MKVKLKRPVTVDDKKIEEIDLDGLDALTGADVMFCRREAAAKKGEPVIFGALDEIYRLEVAAKVSGLGVDALQKLWAPDFEEVDAAVRNFLTGLVSE